MSDTQRITKNISILPHTKCTGCRSCEQSCPKSCILLQPDSEGFYFPSVDDSCIHCGLCVEHCPILTPISGDVFETERCALVLKDKTLLEKSSSGGAFAGIANVVLQSGGVVFGAAFDENLRVRQVAINLRQDLNKIQGSKYVSCDTGDSFSEVKRVLTSGKTVLYGGSPCQIAGLRAFLGKSYQNLFTMDLICHGVPSEKLFQRYLEWQGKNGKGKVIYYGFRDKDIAGWSCGGKTRIKTKTKTKIVEGVCDPYYAAFLRCETYRESCYVCPFAKRNGRIGDISMGDFWGTDKKYPEIPSENGISFCTVNTKQGKRLFELVRNNFDVYPIAKSESLSLNIAFSHPSTRPAVRDSIYDGIDGDLKAYFRKFKRLSLLEFHSRRFIARSLPSSFKKILKKILGKC